MKPLVSVILPVLDESLALPAALDRLAALPGRFEVIVVDGGSRDGSIAVASAHPVGALVIDASTVPSGRATQLNAAASRASGDALLFLHADTALPESAWSSLAAALSDRLVGGNFSLRFDGQDPLSRFLGWLYARLRRFGIYYGDSAVFVRTDLFRALGGFRPLPVMDDYDFVRRLERAGPTACLPGPAITSARRWKQLGAGRTVCSWIAIQALYSAGVSPERLARLYRPAR